MSKNRFNKDPDAVLDYTINWTKWLGSDTISVSTWTVPSGLTEDSDTSGDSSTTIWLSGGTVDANYNIVNHITTAAGREEDQTLIIRCREK